MRRSGGASTSQRRRSDDEAFLQPPSCSARSACARSMSLSIAVARSRSTRGSSRAPASSTSGYDTLALAHGSRLQMWMRLWVTSPSRSSEKLMKCVTSKWSGVPGSPPSMISTFVMPVPVMRRLSGTAGRPLWNTTDPFPKLSNFMITPAYDLLAQMIQRVGRWRKLNIGVCEGGKMT